MRVLLLTVLALALAACGAGEPDSPPAAATGPGLSVSEAIASDLEGPLLVKGHLLERNGELRLCEALAESYPPQCGVATSLVVEGLDLATVDGLESEAGVTWSRDYVELLGTVDDGVLRVSENAQA